MAELLWANRVAYFSVTNTGLPIARWTFDRLSFVTSPYRFDG